MRNLYYNTNVIKILKKVDPGLEEGLFMCMKLIVVLEMLKKEPEYKNFVTSNRCVRNEDDEKWFPMYFFDPPIN